MANQPIPVATAGAMIEEYLAYMSSHDINMEEQTQSVSFRRVDLISWMQAVADYTDEFRIFSGVYPSGPASGRITTIIWPYMNGAPAIGEDQQEIEPFNEGDRLP